MHLIDTTMFFTPRSGGVKRYLLAKREWLHTHTAARHSLVIPGPHTTDDGNGVITVACSPIPGSGGYRTPVSTRGNWRMQLMRLAPDLIEAGDPYLPAWIALEVGQKLGVPVVGFYHSDLTRMLRVRLGRWCWRAAERYVRRLYREFDLVFAPSRIMVERLHDLGIKRVVHQPLGVDTALFHPSRRDPYMRRTLGLADDARLVVFAGRLAREKTFPCCWRRCDSWGRVITCC